MNKLEVKQKEFNKAIDLYHKNFFYRNFNKFISLIILILQIIVCIQLFKMKFNLFIGIISFFIAYIIADFIGGLVHMYMDNNSDYTSILGPFVATFHLHHKKPIYKDRNLLLVYFYESGSKYWLVIYYIIIIMLEYKGFVKSDLYLFLFFVGLLSVIAEVSHYLSHNSKSKIVLFLQRYMILLPKGHHFLHHKKDNINYAFLNGISDPILNLIAKKIYKGYKKNTDKHAAMYIGKNTDNR